MLRCLLSVSLASVLFQVGCGDDDSGGTDRDSGVPRTDSGPSLDANVGERDSGARRDGGEGQPDGDVGEPDSGPDRDSGPAMDSGSTGMAPIISGILWAPLGSCTPNTSSDFSITVAVEDADTPEGMLLYSGGVSGCDGMIDGSTLRNADRAVSTINCPNVAPYTGTVTVEDPEGNSVTETFSFGPCETGGLDF